MDYLKVADRSWPLLRQLMGVHAVIYRVTNGFVGHRFPGSPPVLLLDHVGAKSGIKRTSPLAYVEDGSDVFLIASKGGNPRNPAWNCRARSPPSRRGPPSCSTRARTATTPAAPATS